MAELTKEMFEKLTKEQLRELKDSMVMPMRGGAPQPDAPGDVVKHKLTIDVKGLAGSGKTTIAGILYVVLKNLKIGVTLNNNDIMSDKELDEHISKNIEGGLPSRLEIIINETQLNK